MKSFDEWYFDLFGTGNGIRLNQQEIAEEAYLLGQQSRQAEIDELRKSIDQALNKIEFWTGGENGYAIHVANDIGIILKGNTNEH